MLDRGKDQEGDMEMAQRIKAEVTMMNIYKYEAPAYGYGTETRFIYTMQDQDGTVYVWKTTTWMCINVYEGVDQDHANFYDRKGIAYEPQGIRKGDKIVITASVKGQGEYKGQPQTELTRVKVVERTHNAAAEQKQKKENRKAKQIESLKGEDFIWDMPYSQYKAHYSDCETVVDSYDDHDGRYPATIKVIIREGRLKNSGVRGQHFSGYEFFFIDTDGKKARICYRAVSEDNAMKRLYKEFPEAKEVTPGEIYMYGC